MVKLLATRSSERQLSVTFHVARDPEFLQGVQYGHHLLPHEWDLSGKDGWWNVEDLLSFVQSELRPESLAQENQLRECFEIAPHTPIYNLGLVAGLLGTLALATRMFTAISKPVLENFVISHPAFLAGMQNGANLYRKEYSRATSLTDLALLTFYQSYLTPFDFDPIGNTGVLLGWMREFLTSGLTLEPSTENLDLVAGYYIAAHDWHAWKKEELLTDVGFAGCLENELSPRTLAVMHSAEDWYTEAYQIGYGFGLAHALLSSPDIQMVEQLVSTKPQT